MAGSPAHTHLFCSKPGGCLSALEACPARLRELIVGVFRKGFSDFQSTLLSIKLLKTSRINLLKETVIGFAGEAKRWTVTGVTFTHRINWFQWTFCLSKLFDLGNHFQEAHLLGSLYINNFEKSLVS